MVEPDAEFETQYAALTNGVGLVDLSARTQIELTGADRGKFLHNLCTNAVRDLPVGGGCEAFLLNAKGHVVGHVLSFVGPESIVLEAAPEQSRPLLDHLDRYIIREDVQLHDRSTEWAELLLAGDQADALLTNCDLAAPVARMQHAAASLVGHGVWLRRVDLIGPKDFSIAVRREAFDEVVRALVHAGATRCGWDVFETCRIEQGTPLYGRDIGEENLPQEIDRDRFAISFTKGCYIGQETVARIDSLGHVNRLLRGIRIAAAAAPPSGTDLLSLDKVVGQVTSSCWSPRLKTPLALAYVRRGYHEPGTQLSAVGMEAEVVALPVF
ncbi:MAG: aminomethyltransferase family protein [Pirellulales bacterium]|nr:aminomethyltransferase family protein [Pirellulales bacterium]